MKKHTKQALAVLMAVMMLLSAVPFAGFAGLEMPELGIQAQAAEADDSQDNESGSLSSNPISKIEIEPITIMQGTELYDAYDYDVDAAYLVYRYEIPEYTVYFNDGTIQKIDGWESISIEGEEYYLSKYDDQSYTNRWDVGLHTAHARLGDFFETDFTVEIVPSPIESVNVEKITLIEGIDGHYESGKFVYSLGTIPFSVTLKDGSIVEVDDYGIYKINSVHIDDKDYYLEYDYDLCKSWETGNTYQVDAKICGKAFTIDVETVENPYTSISIEETDDLYLSLTSKDGTLEKHKVTCFMPKGSEDSNGQISGELITDLGSFQNVTFHFDFTDAMKDDISKQRLLCSDNVYLQMGTLTSNSLNKTNWLVIQCKISHLPLLVLVEDWYDGDTNRFDFEGTVTQDNIDSIIRIAANYCSNYIDYHFDEEVNECYARFSTDTLIEDVELLFGIKDIDISMYSGYDPNNPSVTDVLLYQAGDGPSTTNIYHRDDKWYFERIHVNGFDENLRIVFNESADIEEIKYYENTEDNINYRVTVVPTDKKKGTLTAFCDGCPWSKNIDLPKISSDDYTCELIKEASCSATGEVHCIWNDTSYGTVDFIGIISKTSHSCVDQVTLPTCTTEGYTTHTCEVCGESYIDSIVPVIDHSYVEEVTSPTCTTEGYTTYTCEMCGDSYREVIPVIDHSYIEEVTLPTCTNIGYTTYTCEVCGDSHVDNMVSTIPHVDSNGDALCDLCGNAMSDISPNETKTISVTSNKITYLKFIPASDGIYTFQSISNSDTYGYLYDENKNQLAYNDDGGNGNNFLITYTLEKGKTYYWGAKFYNSSTSGSFDVKLVCDQVFCSHLNQSEVPGKAQTCDEDGYTKGVLCTDCNTWISGHEKIARHFDDDNDEICDQCRAILSTVVATENAGPQAVYTVYANGTMVISGNGATYDYRFYSNSSRIKNLIIEDGITAIGNNAFYYYYKNLKSVTISDSVTDIGYNAFYNCTGLTSITLGSGVTNIGNYAFGYCTRLTDIIWNAENVKDLLYYSNAFYKAGVKGEGISVVFGDNVKRIPANAFYVSNSYYSPKLRSVTVGNNVAGIGENAFRNCNGIEWLELPENVEVIGDYAFFNSGVESVLIQGAPKTIGLSAFSSMPNLRTVSIESDTVLNSDVFAYCHELETVYITGNVQSIPVDAFYMCENLTNIQLPSSVSSIGDAAFAGCFALTDIALPEGIKVLPYNAFASCRSLEHIELPSTLEMLGDDVFYDCIRLTDITIPYSVKRIGPSVFYNCNNLSSIDIQNPDCEIYASENTINHSAVIFGKAKSTAEKYAKQYNRIFRTEEVKSVSLLSKPERLDYYMGDEFDIRGLSLSVRYVNGRTEILQDIGSVVGFNSREPGTFDVCVTFGGKTSESFEVTVSERTITLRESVNVTVQPGQRAYYKFVPKVSGYYYVTENSYYGTYAKLLDSKLRKINTNFDEMYNRAELIAGETYYICTGLNDGYSDGEDYSYEITLEARSLNCPHGNTETFEKIDATCQDVGYTEGVFCHDCETWISGHVLIPKHVDINNDMICDNCGEDVSKPVKSGKCGKSAFYDLYENGTLHIYGTGSMYGSYEPDGLVYGNSFSKLIIDEGITEIDEYAFYNCRSLEEAILPDSLITIGDYAFAVSSSFSNGDYINSNISNLRSINLGPNVETIGDGAFENCIKLQTLNLPASLKEIGRYAFKGVDADQITIPNGVESVGEDAFACYYEAEGNTYYGIKNITMEQGFTSISQGMFADSLVESIVIPDGVENVPPSFAYNCRNLTEVTVPESVINIEHDAFSACPKLESIVISNKDAHVYDAAFDNNTAVQSYWSVYENSYYGYNFKPFDAEKIEIETLPKKISYKTDESFDPYGLTLKVTYADGYSETVNDRFKISGFDSATAGKKPLTVSFAGKECQFSVKVIDYNDLTITANTTRSVTVNGTQQVYLKFIPTVTASYTFSSSAFSRDTYGYLYDGEKNVLCEDDDSAENGNFSITVQLVEGTKYYFAARFVNEDEYGTFDVTLVLNKTTDPSDCNHSYQTIVTPATCTVPEFTTFTCTACGFSYSTITKAAQGHNLISRTASIANCINDGLIVYSCTKCDFSKVEVVPALGHKVEQVASPEDPGKLMNICKVCGIDVDNPPVPDENGHTYIEETTDPTCTEKGYTTHTCTICGDSYVDSYIDALGHDMTHSVTTKEPTCTQKGEETISCSRCDYSETRQLDALSHVVVTDETIAPSCTEDGLTEGSHCSRCGEILVERKVIPATGHIDENDDGNCDNCGNPIHTVTPENCSCRCHKKGFSGFIYKIMRIFWKLFRINKVCVCGEEHY